MVRPSNPLESCWTVGFDRPPHLRQVLATAGGMSRRARAMSEGFIQLRKL
jgi:hypothetical protein